ncbi:TetR family transcriptional regulator [Bordetella bronchialis]|uniref:TetR family transcriptional regulator n=1 Tax=Bordetella bronchialis TaxID=463025 RepID=A0A193FK54_9BORD|nr:TetR family transcriptional regulator [Bordetella bronchialis]ANN67561.1 TetR family transcriptional regulator [Bordetella bronchialis]ANN72650.1 TetR family transcriptional regulator [Bordetella bronchialis]
MTDRQTPRISSRKQPQQARSTELVAAILQAAAQVLEKEGAARFTTARIAERAGVSVGSVYQYFPNKAAILFRLQLDEWRQTTEMMLGILADVRRPPRQRLRALVHAFLRSECEEARMRMALHDAAPLYRDAPEARQAHASGKQAMQAFMRELLPESRRAIRTVAGDLIMTTLAKVGKHFSGSPRSAAEIKAYANAMGDMFCAYVDKIEPESHPAARRPSSRNRPRVRSQAAQ